MKKVILLLSAVLFVVSCSNDKDDDIIKKETSKGKLEKLILVSENQTEEHYYIYGENGFVKEMRNRGTYKYGEDKNEVDKYNSIVKFHYNSKNYVDKIKVYKDETDEKPRLINISYDDKGRISSFSRGNHIEIFKYNKKGEVVESKYDDTYVEDGVEKTRTYTTIYKYDSEGNLISESRKGDGSSSNTIYL